MIAAARALKFSQMALSPTQPVIFTLKDIYSRAWILPLNVLLTTTAISNPPPFFLLVALLTTAILQPMYVADPSLNLWTQWMVPHYVSGALAGFTYSALLHIGSRLPLRDTAVRFSFG